VFLHDSMEMWPKKLPNSDKIDTKAEEIRKKYTTIDTYTVINAIQISERLDPSHFSN